MLNIIEAEKRRINEEISRQQTKLYTAEYRRLTGISYTPYCFVKKQNELLNKYYGENWQDEYIVFDPCCGVGNLEDDFPEEYIKNYCYLSTLEQMDVDRCKSKGFVNVRTYDYLADNKEPTFKYKGQDLTIDKIAEQEGKKLMIIMNPPYQRRNRENTAITFFNKVCKLKPETIVFYYNTNSFWNNEIENYIDSKYKVVNHIMSTKKNTFLLTDGPISQIIFDKNKGTKIDKMNLPFDRYEYYEKLDTFDYIKTYTYQQKPSLIDDINEQIKTNSLSLSLGSYVYLSNCINLINSSTKNELKKITIDNLKYCLLSKGINFNTHCQYFEINDYVYKGKIEDIPEELFNDSIMFSLYYIGNGFSNRPSKNYIMPFTAEELGCNKNDLNELELKDDFGKHTGWWNFRDWFHQFNFSQEAKDLYNSALEIFRWYHSTGNYVNCGFQKSSGQDFNDSFYDITKAIMDKIEFQEYKGEKDTRINKVKTTKGTTGFGRNTYKKKVDKQFWPIFENFFDKRDILARKINKQLVDNGLLLWERGNIY